ncbi:MAG TPA: anhydro-N-acetylmuramic acid kinase [Acholeplasmataceae bacterium]|jgi:anhydro-N-acetylmuramic acid kinase|nr:anhydro-N-acetylmuramic acid kinase [Acholeplasmataceae bacterium]
MLAIGLMSGTSLDGVDAALVEIEGKNVKLIKYALLKYDEDFRKKIFRNLNKDTARLDEICNLNFALGYKFKEAIDLVLEDTGYTYDDIEFVASHGQTIWHDPNGNPPSTLQIGEASVISYLTNIKTISNFRVMDVAAGGEGAPLVPFSEYYLYQSDDKNIVLQNIGGISNLSFLPKGGTLDDVFSFDCGVGNIMIDYFTKKYFGKPYDEDGKIALSGKVIDEILDELNKDEFIYKNPPKSTGREQYSQSFMEELALRLDFDKYNKKDIITTITEFTVYGITYNYQKFLKDIDIAIVCGGGSHNQYIMKRLKENFTNIKILTGEEYGINSDAKEAVAFAILGYMTIQNKPSNVRSATGAKSDVILGNITPSPREKND